MSSYKRPGSEQRPNDSVSPSKFNINENQSDFSRSKLFELREYQSKNDEGVFDLSESENSRNFDEEIIKEESPDSPILEEKLKTTKYTNSYILQMFLLVGFLIFDLWLLFLGLMSDDCCISKCRLIVFLFITSLVSTAVGCAILGSTVSVTFPTLDIDPKSKQRNRTPSRMNTSNAFQDGNMKNDVITDLEVNDISIMSSLSSANSSINSDNAVHQLTKIDGLTCDQPNYHEESDNPITPVKLALNLGYTLLSNTSARNRWLSDLTKKKRILLFATCLTSIISLACGCWFGYRSNCSTTQDIERKQNQMKIVAAIGLLVLGYSAWQLIMKFKKHFD